MNAAPVTPVQITPTHHNTPAHFAPRAAPPTAAPGVRGAKRLSTRRGLGAFLAVACLGLLIPAGAQANSDDLLARIGAGAPLPAVQPEWLVTHFARRFAAQDVLGAGHAQASVHLQDFVASAEQHNAPLALALLPYIEAGFNPTPQNADEAGSFCTFLSADVAAQAPVNATPEAALARNTQARQCAGRLFEQLAAYYAQFGHWHLALAARNAGPAAVRDALAYNRIHGLPLRFEYLALPTQTRLYVPALLGLAGLVRNPTVWGVQLPAVPAHGAPRWVRAPGPILG